MPMTITLELSNKDLRYFRQIMREVRDRSSELQEDEIIAAVHAMVDDVRESQTTEFVLKRLDRLQQMVAMLEDEDWKMEGKDRSRVADGLVYFAEGEDLIPDRIPGLGYLDDAIMIELVVRDLRHEIEAYEDFCKFRKETGRSHKSADDDARETWLGARRAQLQARMRRRRRRDRTSKAGARPATRVRLF